MALLVARVRLLVIFQVEIDPACPVARIPPALSAAARLQNQFGRLTGLVVPDRNRHGGTTVGGRIRFAGDWDLFSVRIANCEGVR